jgi:excisionase family DNA binding protein
MTTDLATDERLLIDLPEVATRLNISKRKVEALIANRELGHVKVGRRTLVTRRQIDAYIEQLEEGAAPTLMVFAGGRR